MTDEYIKQIYVHKTENKAWYLGQILLWCRNLLTVW